MINRENTIERILKEKIIVIMRGFTKEQIVETARAMLKGGVSMLELTFDQRGITPDCEIAENIKLLKETFGDELSVGAGTVMSVEQVELAKNAGAEFIISPDTFKDVIERTRELEMVSIPGAITPTEAAMAHRYGADFVKLFPFSHYGVKYLKDLSAPLSHIRFLAVGGVNAENIPEFIKAGACGFGIGTNLANKEMINLGRYDMIEVYAKKYRDAVKRG